VDLLIAAATLWCLFGLFLFLPLVGAREQFRRAAGVLLGLQFVALLASGYGAEVGDVVASQDLPLLTLVLLATAVAFGLKTHRRQASFGTRPRPTDRDDRRSETR
jgi:hypothetical protein